MTPFPSLFRHSLARLVLLLCMYYLELATSRGRPFLLAPFRGGTAFSSSKNQKKGGTHVQSTVGVLAVGEVVTDENNQHIDSTWLAGSNDDCSAACVMLNPKGEFASRISYLPQDDPMVQSLVFLCDAVVVFLMPPHGNDDVAALVASLREGAKKRLEARGCKGRLILVLPFAKDEDLSPMMDDLIMRQFADIVPNEWSTFDIISESELEQHLLREILNEKTGKIRSIFPEDEDNTHFFSKLLQKLYQMEGGEAGKGFEIQNLPLVDKQVDNNSHTQPQLRTDKSVVDNDQDSQMQEILIRCHVQLEAMESKLQDVLLRDQEKRLPLLDFGAMADALLNQTIADLEKLLSSFDLAMLAPAVSELQRLYRDHLQTIRDYYGKRYERILEESNEEAAWTSAAEHFMQGFQAAASNSVPSLCRPNEVLADWADAFDSTNTLQGLISDMLEATQIRKDEQSLAMEGEDDFQEQGTLGRFHRVPRWLKKIAGRALVLGVNYIQGWLAWQGVKRAAIERDLSMPKFPLF